MADLSTKQWWDAFHERTRAREVFHEWYLPTDEVMAHIAPALRTGMKILHTGCGSSEITSVLWKAGYRDIVSVDFSENIIQVIFRSAPR